MSGFLLDTNVISELLKPKPNPSLRRWIDGHDERTLFLSVLTVGEIRQGIEMRRADARQFARLEPALADFQARFAERILDVDQIVAETWGEINGRARTQGGGPLSAVDSLIAATAMVHRLIVVTRNVRHFERSGAAIVNPFEQAEL